MGRKATVQNPRGLSLDRRAQGEVQVSTFPDSDENFDSDIHNNISSIKGNTSETSETDLESDDKNDELNNEVAEDELHDTSGKESQISSQERNYLLDILEKQLNERILENKSLLPAVYTITSQNTAEIWALGNVQTLDLKKGWPLVDTLFSYIEVRVYGLVVCPPQIYERARQLLRVGGTMYYVQILSGVSEKSRYDHHKSDMEQEFQVPTGFSFYKVLKLSLGIAVYSSWKKENDCGRWM